MNTLGRRRRSGRAAGAAALVRFYARLAPCGGIGDHNNKPKAALNVAAFADYTPTKRVDRKRKKDDKPLTLMLKPIVDILATSWRGRLVHAN